MILAVLSIFPIFVLASLIVWFLCAGVKPCLAKVALVGCLTFGVIIGSSSMVYFLGLVAIGARSSHRPFELVLVAGGCALMTFLLYRSCLPVVVDLQPANRTTGWLSKLLGLAFWATLATAVCRYAVISLRIPHGRGDARAIWNLRARFFHRAGDEWMTALDSRLSHADYPLLLPGSIARLWDDLGSETTLVPQLIALGFMVGTVGVVASTLNILRSPSQGWLSGLVLLGGRFVPFDAAGQAADVPLAFYIVGTLALLAIYDCGTQTSPRLLILAGVCAGFAAWTKNEGLLFLVCLSAARGVIVARRNGWRTMLGQSFPILWGALSACLMLAYFKVICPATNDLVAGQGWELTLGRLADGSRHLMILTYIFPRLRGIPNLLLLAVAVYWLLVGGIPRRENLRLAATPLLCLALMSIGYYVVYLTTPHDLAWHLRTSLHRLMLHLMPSLVLGIFLALGTIEEKLVVRSVTDS